MNRPAIERLENDALLGGPMAMRRLQRILAAAAFLAGVAPVLALSEPSVEEYEVNRRLLEQWRSDPEHAARLQRDLAVFRSLPPERQEQLRQLERDLLRQDSATRGRLLGVAQRYADWLARLSEEERNEVLAAPAGKERVQAIRKVRNRRWLAHLPRADRERLRNALPKERQALAQKILGEQRQYRHDWQIALRFWDDLMHDKPLPARLEEFPANVQVFVRDSVLPFLSDEEKQRLEDAGGKWPRYPQTLVEFADQHPLSVPGPVGPIRRADVEKKLKFPPKSRSWERLHQVEGKWPEFGVALRREVVQHKKIEKLAAQLPLLLTDKVTPCRPGDFSPAVRRFINQDLRRILLPDEKVRLDNAEGRWPDYPWILVDLARKHNLQVPDMTLPGPRAQWDKYRLRAHTTTAP